MDGICPHGQCAVIEELELRIFGITYPDREQALELALAYLDADIKHDEASMDWARSQKDCVEAELYGERLSIKSEALQSFCAGNFEALLLYFEETAEALFEMAWELDDPIFGKEHMCMDKHCPATHDKMSEIRGFPNHGRAFLGRKFLEIVAVLGVSNG